MKSAIKPDPKPKVVKRDEVIDDYIRNFLNKFSMSKTLNIFQVFRPINPSARMV
jgi:hypothetical protein